MLIEGTKIPWVPWKLKIQDQLHENCDVPANPVQRVMRGAWKAGHGGQDYECSRSRRHSYTAATAGLAVASLWLDVPGNFGPARIEHLDGQESSQAGSSGIAAGAQEWAQRQSTHFSRLLHSRIAGRWSQPAGRCSTPARSYSHPTRSIHRTGR